MKFWPEIKQFVYARRYDIIIAVVIFVVAAIPRLLDLGTFLTADEKNWMGRAYEFIKAFKDLRFNDMLQTTHPGVVPLWLMGLSITAKMFLSHTPFTFQTLPNFIVAAQFPIALVNSLAIPVIYLFLRQVFNNYKLQITNYGLPGLASLFIALDPFIIGYSRVAHVDATLASFLFLAALATIIYAQKGFSRVWLIISAILSGLAILTKAPAIFMIPFFWLAVLVFKVYASRPSLSSPKSVSEPSRHGLSQADKAEGGGAALTAARRDPSGDLPLANRPVSFWGSVGWVERARDFSIWLLIVGILFVVVWPVFIGVENPKGNANLLKRDLGTAAITPHHMSEDYSVNPWHYPAAILARTTPVILIFALVAAIHISISILKFLIGRRSSYHQLPITNYVLLLSYIFFFTLMMTIGAKKGDRYILPIFPMLDVLAAVGVISMGTVASRVWDLKLGPLVGRWKLPSALLPTFSLLYLAFVAADYHPYAIAYANPLFRDNLSQELGWGEGLEQVGAWLSQHDPNATVASWYNQELGAFTSATALTIGAHEAQNVKYVVLYRNMFGRAADHPANDYIDEYYTKREPVFTATVHGKPFAWVYKKPTFPTIIGELLPNRVEQQVLPARYQPVGGVGILVATYNGRANTGELVVDMLDRTGRVVHTWRTPINTLIDDAWLRLALPQPLAISGDITVRIQAIGTQALNAPTLRRGENAALAVRLLYQAERELAHEDQSKLLGNPQ